MVRHHPSKFGGNSHCGSGDIMFVVAKGQDSTCPRLDRPILFISKVHGVPCSHIQNFKTETQ